MPKKFEFSSLIEILPLLHPVTPMDENHPAHWWSTDFGMKIQERQKSVIHIFKDGCYRNRINEKEIFAQVFNTYMIIQWPLDYDNQGFWKSQFGLLIIEEWKAMIQKFVDAYRALE